MPLASGNFKIFTTLHKPATRKMATRVKLPSNARPVDVDPKERVVALCSFTIPGLRGEPPGFPERRLGPPSECREESFRDKGESRRRLPQCGFSALRGV